MNFKAIIGAFAASAVIASSAQAAIIYSIDNGATSTILDPLSSNESAASYYSYNSPFGSSGDPDFGTTSGVGYFWLYENSNNGDLSLGMIFDTPKDGSGGRVSLT